MAVEIKITEVQEKLNKGTELSKEEKDFVKSTPKSSDTNDVIEEAPEDLTVPSGIRKPAEEDEEGQTAEPEDNKAEEPEDTPSEKKEAEPAASKSPEKDEITAETRKKLEVELDKPEGHEDLSGYNPREIGLFLDMRKQRSRAQRAEEENEQLKFERMQGRLKEKKPEPVEEDELKDRDDADIVTIGEVRKLLAKKPDTTHQEMLTNLYIQNQKLEARIVAKEKGITDLEAVINFAEDALGKDEDAKAYLTKVAASRGNVVLATYNLVKASKAWPDIEKSIRVAQGNKIPAENVERAEKIEKNEKKIKTTGPGGGGSAESVPGEYTVGEILAMPTEEFASLPKAKRKAIMEKYGSNPNMSV